MGMLSGIRVLDLSLQLPGPFCTMIMADYGAEVIKVDEPYPRVRNPFAGKEPGLSPAERYLNRGKRSLTLNLKTGEGREIFRTRADAADVVGEGFRPGVVERLGVDYPTLSARNPRLVYCSISGFGQAGPMRTVAGHDINYISYTGILGISGRWGDPPAIPPVQIGDLFGGSMMALSGILMALLSRQSSGQGRLVDVSMADGAMSMLAFHAAEFFTGGVLPERGNMPLTGRFPCYETYRCMDGQYISVGSLETWFWEGLVKIIGREDLLPFHSTDGEEGEKARAELAKVFIGKTRDEWVKFFEGKDVCFSPVLTLAEALDHPNAKEREMVVEVGSPLGGREKQLGLPVKFYGPQEVPPRTPSAGGPAAPVPRRASFLGENDEEILKEIGYTAAQVEELRDRGVVRKA